MEHSYIEAVQAIKTAILQGQYEASRRVNRIQLAVYYGIGRYLSQHTRKGVWGTGALKAISLQLQKELPGLRGYSEESLKLMRRFYEGWTFLDSKSQLQLENSNQDNNNSVIAITELQTPDKEININSAITITELKDFPVEDFFKVPFTHHIRIIDNVKTLPERYYYIHRTAEEHLTESALKNLMKEDAYNSQESIPNNFTRTLTNAEMARKAVMMFKNEYMLNFINTEQIGERDEQDIDERVVEQQIVHNIKKFIMTFGNDFAFIGNQYHLEIYSEEFFPDLLFFNRELNCMVCIELKTGKFKPSYLGQLTTYLRILDDKVKKPHENPSIGIVLCKEADKQFVEYVIQDYQKPMGVATYSTSEDLPEKLKNALPDIDDMRKLLE